MNFRLNGSNRLTEGHAKDHVKIRALGEVEGHRLIRANAAALACLVSDIRKAKECGVTEAGTDQKGILHQNKRNVQKGVHRMDRVPHTTKLDRNVHFRRARRYTI